MPLRAYPQSLTPTQITVRSQYMLQDSFNSNEFDSLTEQGIISLPHRIRVLQLRIDIPLQKRLRGVLRKPRHELSRDLPLHARSRVPATRKIVHDHPLGAVAAQAGDEVPDPVRRAGLRVRRARERLAERLRGRGGRRGRDAVADVAVRRAAVRERR